MAGLTSPNGQPLTQPSPLTKDSTQLSLTGQELPGWGVKPSIYREPKKPSGTATIDEPIGIGWDHYQKAPNITRDLTNRQAHEIAKRYLHGDNQIVIRLTQQ